MALLKKLLPCGTKKECAAAAASATLRAHLFDSGAYVDGQKKDAAR